MAVRMIEMSLPVDRLEPLRERVRDLEPIEMDAFADEDGRRAILRVMVRKAQVEHFVNQFESLAERYDDFRMTLFAVEATLIMVFRIIALLGLAAAFAYYNLQLRTSG